MVRLTALVVLMAGWPTVLSAQPSAPGLQQQLAKEPPAELAKAARARGDAGRGAVLFFQPFLGCAKCHDESVGTQIGPDLTKIGKEGTAEHLAESILAPSKQIRKGYEATSITTADGRTLVGIVVMESKTHLTLIDPAAAGKTVAIAIAEIESRKASAQSLMPEGMASMLSDRQQFLDLVKYLIEIAEQGPARAKALRPAQTALVIPEYEKEIDHAGMIRTLDNKALARGEAIYTRVCANCHGTKDAPGSMPTSIRFAEGKFKNGADPFAMYQTLTRGYAFMMPQTWMVPRQKYDVIHYIREKYLKPHNATQYVKADAAYLATLPKGTTFGPAPVNVEPWVTMDYGPSLMNSYEVGGPGPNLAYKALAMRLDAGAGGVSRGRHWALFDHDTLRVAATWSGQGFIDWKGIHFNGQHQVHPKLVGDVTAALPVGPGWANPANGSFDDPRLVGRDGRLYGPLPAGWAQFKGTYHFGDRTVIAYTVGTARVLESHGLEQDSKQPTVPIFARTIDMISDGHEHLARIAPAGVAVEVIGDERVALVRNADFTLLKIPALTGTVRVKVLVSKGDANALAEYAKHAPPPTALKPLTEGGPRRWPEALTTNVIVGQDNGPFAVDTFELPLRNPWNAQLRLTGFDFFPDGDRAAVCSWDGDVWIVNGFLNPAKGLTWRRHATGLYQPLGLKIRDGGVFVCCRDQIVQLHDLNRDGEADWYECFNSDHQVTEHFHEFAMGLQTDDAGNFYYAKSGRHALGAVVPQHGTLLKVDRSGASTEILATGFRAANGVCLNPDGTFFVTDQEGFWTPKNRINLVEKGGFYGNLFGYTDITDTSDAAMKQPLCWITNAFDRSPAELVWVTSDKWDSLKGALLQISYGMGKIYVVPHETVNGQTQGGMVALPIPAMPTGIMRGRFHPVDGQLYTLGMYAWAGNQTQPGGFYRVRRTDKPADMPVGLKATANGVELTFTDALDAATANDVKNFSVKVWGLNRTKNYGSKHIDEHALTVTHAALQADGKTLRMTLEGIKPTWCMEIDYRLKGRDGRAVVGTIHNTIHQLPQAQAP